MLVLSLNVNYLSQSGLDCLPLANFRFPKDLCNISVLGKVSSRGRGTVILEDSLRTIWNFPALALSTARFPVWDRNPCPPQTDIFQKEATQKTHWLFCLENLCFCLVKRRPCLAFPPGNCSSAQVSQADRRKTGRRELQTGGLFPDRGFFVTLLPSVPNLCLGSWGSHGIPCLGLPGPSAWLSFPTSLPGRRSFGHRNVLGLNNSCWIGFNLIIFN